VNSRVKNCLTGGEGSEKGIERQKKVEANRTERQKEERNSRDKACTAAQSCCFAFIGKKVTVNNEQNPAPPACAQKKKRIAANGGEGVI